MLSEVSDVDHNTTCETVGGACSDLHVVQDGTTVEELIVTELLEGSYLFLKNKYCLEVMIELAHDCTNDLFAVKKCI